MSNAAKKRLLALLEKHNISKDPTGGIRLQAPAEGVEAFTQDNAQDNTQGDNKNVSPSEISYNDAQTRAINLGISGKSFVLTGSAGTGKTTTVKGLISRMMQEYKIGTLQTTDHKWLQRDMHSIACVSFTNKAVQNLKKALPKDLHSNCMTIHKLLEYQPVYDTVHDPATGSDRTTMTFEPARHEGNPLPYLDVLIIDEATMTDVSLWNKLADAIPYNTQVILIGDIHQLPPVFGKSIFIWAMNLKAEVVELTHVYRQALESPIISLALRVKEGKQIPQKELQDFTQDKGEKGKVTIHPWKKKLGETAATLTMQKFLPQLIDSGKYNPWEDVILTPFNKSFGTIALNISVASHLASIEPDPEKQKVWEIYSGVKKVYYRVGEKVLFQKSEAFITKIESNSGYYGKLPRPPSSTMDYNGVETDQEKALMAAASQSFGSMETLDSVDAMLAHMGTHVDDDKKLSREASHSITVYIPDLDTTQTVSSAGDINAMDLGYALTVHKSQGSEYDRVFLITHGSQSNMFFRELLYTAVTRAAKELYVICEPNFFVKGVVSQRVPGTTLEEKIESFNRATSMGAKAMGDEELPRGTRLLVEESTEEIEPESFAHG